MFKERNIFSKQVILNTKLNRAWTIWTDNKSKYCVNDAISSFKGYGDTGAKYNLNFRQSNLEINEQETDYIKTELKTD